MNLRLVTGPAVEPVSLDEAKAHVKQLDPDDDTYITALIPAARQVVESGESWSLERSLVATVWRLTLDRFPGGCAPGGGGWPGDPLAGGVIELPRPPLISVTSVTYVDTAGVTRTLDPSMYRVDADAEPARLTPAFGQVWPMTQDVTAAVRVTFRAGYGEGADDVPRAIRQAILLLLGDLYEQRQSVITGTIVNVLPACRALLNAFKWSYR